MSNFAFNNPAFQQQDPRNVATYPGTPQGAQAASFQHASVDAAVNAQLEGMYAAPPAGAIETDRMSVEDTVWKTAGLFGILLVTAAIGWVFTLGGVAAPERDPYSDYAPSLLPWIVGAFGGFVLAMIISFTSRKKVRPALIFAYAAFEGLFIGGISAFFEVLWPGIVTQATIATLAVVGVTLALFASGKIRASKKATKIFMIAMFGYLAFSLINVILMWTGVVSDGFGLHSQVKIAGIPLGLIIGVLVVIMAAYSLVLDFDQVQQGVRNGAPRKYGWLGAFGIMVTVVWLYVEILRIIAIARGNN
ncbi:Bax inhibitor-1/YccA family membrane protein [Microbacterium sp.]|uniref:Bax inhibitor-1/YccA family protein n=1 Tax=Microbacterium sp. TaxID=51671 RepID=UPI0039E721D8